MSMSNIRMWAVMSWTTSASTLLAIYQTRAEAATAAAAVVLTGGVVGSGFFPHPGTEELVLSQGVSPT
jgi:hypothetical protein